jgi:hypothetical protein
VTQIPRLDPIEYLLARKLASLSLLAPGASDLTTNDEAVDESLRKCKQFLEALSPYELTKLFLKEQAQSIFDEHRFNSPSAQANFDYWSSLPHWTVDEAIALSFGKAPEQVNWATIEGLVDRSTFAVEYSRRRELTTRAAVGKQLGDPLIPGAFVAWAKQIGIALPVDLKDAVEARGFKMPDWEALRASLEATIAERDATIEAAHRELEELRRLVASAAAADEELDPRERNSLVALVIGMAIGGYGYVPDPDKNSEVPGQIANDLAGRGLSLSLKTIRKYLDEGTDLMPREV